MNIRYIAFVLLAILLTSFSLCAAEPSSSSMLSAARGLLKRVVPKQAGQFVIQTIPAANGQDVFEVESFGDKIVLRGNNAVSIASALNWYLKEMCHCDISWGCGDQLAIPKELPVVRKKVHVVSPFKYRYAYNFCTHGYTMAWWRWPQWQRELDLLAIHGVNVALIIEGQESVWINTFTNFDYSPAEIRGWVVDPAHLPWMEMGNMENYGGPLSKELVEQRLKLGQQIVHRMRELGIEPALPGYYGMVPPGFKKRFPNTMVLEQGDWSGLARPAILDPTDPMFAKVAKAYYSAETDLFGAVPIYAADPFHEGGSTHGIDLPSAGRAIFDAMNGATWLLQSWDANPRQEMIAGLDQNKLLVLDLWCEAQENWRLRNSFGGVPWLWCIINNFGGNVGLGGRLDWTAKGPADAFADPKKGRMSGIGALMEGSRNNPALWEFFLDNAWRTNTPDLDHWLVEYAQRRYGVKSRAVDKAWKILASTVYDAPASKLQLPVNSVICARPSLNPDQHARRWASTHPYYNTAKLVQSWKLMLDAGPEAKSSEGYRFDLCDIGRQVLANLGTRYDQQIIVAYKAKDKNALRFLSAKMLGLIRDLNTLTGTQRQWLLGVWLSEARSWGSTPAEKNLCERNARELLTVWTDHDNITDYANRQWNGLLGDFYYHRWAMWLKALNQSLAIGVPIDELTERKQIKDWELSWTRQTKEHFATQPHGDAIAISQKLFAKYADTASQSSPDSVNELGK